MKKGGIIGENYSSRETGSARMKRTNKEGIIVDDGSMKDEDNKGKSPTQNTKSQG